MKKLDPVELRRICDEPCPVYLYGATAIAKHVIPVLQELGVAPIAIFDGDPLKQDKEILGIPVYSPERLRHLKSSSVFFITCTYFASVSKKLEDNGFKEKIYDVAHLLEIALVNGYYQGEESRIDIERFFYAIDRKVDIFLGIESPNLIVTSLDVIVSERCTLKCHDCANLMPYFIKPINIDTQTIMEALDYVMEHAYRVNELRILGGEPFLNKEVHKIVEKCTQYANCEKVVIYSNATLVPRDEQIPAFQHKKVVFELTNYGHLSPKLQEIIALFDGHEINYKVKELPATWDDSANISDFGRTNEELADVFKNCCSTNLTTLMHGSLYRCPFSASLDALKVINFDPKDKVVLSDCEHGEAGRKLLSDFVGRKTPLDSCRYCQGRGFEFDRVTPARQAKSKREPNILPLHRIEV